jgi:hypothetical protein
MNGKPEFRSSFRQAQVRVRALRAQALINSRQGVVERSEMDPKGCCDIALILSKVYLKSVTECGRAPKTSFTTADMRAAAISWFVARDESDFTFG